MRAVWITGAGALLTALALPLAAGSARAATASIGAGSCTTYPYASTHGTDPNGFQAPNETSYAAACLDGNGYDVAKTEVGPRATVTFQQPGTWAATARSGGFVTGSVPAAGLLIELPSGAYANVPQGNGATLELAGPFLGVVVDAAAGAPTFRVWDTSEGRIETYTATSTSGGSPTYIDLAGGHRAASAAPTAPTGGTVRATSSPTPTTAPTTAPTSASPTPTTSAPTTTSTTPLPTTSAPSASPSDAPLTTRSASSDHADRGLRYGLGAVSAVLIVLVLGLLARVAVSRRRP